MAKALIYKGFMTIQIRKIKYTIWNTLKSIDLYCFFEPSKNLYAIIDI